MLWHTKTWRQGLNLPQRPSFLHCFWMVFRLGTTSRLSLSSPQA